MKRFKYICTTFYIVILIAFTGCRSSIQIKAEKNGTETFSISLDLGKILSDTIKEASAGISEMNSSGGLSSTDGIIIFETEKIKSALKNSGFSNVNADSPEFSRLNVSGTGNLGNLTELTESHFQLRLSPESIKEFFSKLPQEIQSFTDLLMAPVFTGEKMTPDEYADLIAVVYGEELAGELKKAEVELILVSPEGKTKKYPVSLSDLLTLTEEQIYSIEF